MAWLSMWKRVILTHILIRTLIPILTLILTANTTQVPVTRRDITR